ncbi:Alginate regulatory protein AlgP [Candidatus Burkholderia humilis]|nr:Alginate regulatory protein AlgP [Candidatus Burkholderia humilis]
MTDNAGGTPPFSIPGFSGFGQPDMMGKMWELMRLNPFTAAMQGGAPGVGPSLSMMSDMFAPLTNIEEIDKRVTDMRAVEHWLKLNLNMLQSAIQALEVQRATLATLRAFGTYAQTSVENAQNTAASADKPKAAGWPMSGAAKPEVPPTQAVAATSLDVEEKDAPSGEQSAAPPPGFDPSGWWNVLQSQFNQLAHLAMLQPSMTGAPELAAAQDPGAAGQPADDEPSAAVKKAPARKSAPRKKAP